MSEVELAIDGAAARLTLNRPKALNALTHDMVLALDAALDEVLGTTGVSVVFLEGAGQKAFCAGGDIVMLRQSALDRDGRAEAFWRDEYALNLRLAGFPKPVVAFAHGVVMGGGIGLAGHAAHRVVTESTSAAMPEVGIGFAPDVGGTWLLSRSPGELGTHLALTGSRVGPADAILVGLADAHVPEVSREPLFAHLAGGEDVQTALARHTTDPGQATLAEHRGWVDPSYARDDAAEIVRALQARPEPEAHAAAQTVLEMSPTSVAVTLAALRRARTLPGLSACLDQELAISRAFLEQPDFVEGVRAQLVDKDRTPTWSPASLDEVDMAAFAGLEPAA